METALKKATRHLLVSAMVLAGILVWVAIPDAGPAEPRPSFSSGQIRFYIDTAGFRGSGGAIYQEVYFLLPGDQLVFQPEREGGYTAVFSVDLCVRSASGDTLQHSRIIRRTHADSVSQGRVPAGTAAVLDVFPVTLQPGDHLLTITVRDTVSGREGACRQALSTVTFDPDHLSLSDIQIGTSISDAEEKGRFVKNRKLVTPNVTRSVPSTHPSLFLYFEVYNLEPARTGEPESFSVTYAILDSTENEVRRFPVRMVAKPGRSCSKTEMLDLSGLAPGDYVLRAGVSEALGARVAEGRRSFRLLPAPVSASVLSLDEEALRRYYEGIKYLATQKELDLYRSLAPEGKRKFVIDFWKRRDPTPATPENELAGEHFRRTGYADQNFRQGRVKGSDSDRGRIYIVYGPPADIARRTQPTDGKSFEIWTYETGGHYQFVFIDRRGTGEYELIHSTMPGEKYNPMWQDEPGLMLR